MCGAGAGAEGLHGGAGLEYHGTGGSLSCVESDAFGNAVDEDHRHDGCLEPGGRILGNAAACFRSFGPELLGCRTVAIATFTGAEAVRKCAHERDSPTPPSHPVCRAD